MHTVPGPGDDANLAGFRVTTNVSRTVNSVNLGQLEIDAGTFQVNNAATGSKVSGFLLDAGATLRVAGGQFAVLGAELRGTVQVQPLATFRFQGGLNNFYPGASLIGTGDYLAAGDVFGGPTINLLADLTGSRQLPAAKRQSRWAAEFDHQRHV